MKKKTYTPEYKAKIVIEMLRDETHAGEIAAREEISRTQLQNWKKEFLDNAALVFSQNKVEKQAKAEVKAAEEREDELMKKVGCLSIENDFLKKKYREIHGHDYEGRK
jgi:transposase-like protein